MKEGWQTKTNPRNNLTTWHYYREGHSLCNQNNYFLDTDKLKASPEISQHGNQIICKKCREKWSLKK